MGSKTFTNSIYYSYAGPQLLDVSPRRIPTTGGTEVSIFGVNFGIDVLKEYQHRAITRQIEEEVTPLYTWRNNTVMFGTSECKVKAVRTCV